MLKTNQVPDWMLTNQALENKHRGYNPRTGTTLMGSGKRGVMAELNGVPGIMEPGKPETFVSIDKDLGSGQHHARYKEAVNLDKFFKAQLASSPVAPSKIESESDVNKTLGGELNIEKQPPQRPLRDADPLPKTLAEAYKILGPEPVGDTALGRFIGTPNNSGFIELTPEMQQEIAGVWSNDMMSPTNVVQYDKSIFEEPPVAFSPSEVPVSFDYGDLKLTSGIDDHVMPGLTPKTGLQALRADEESQGLLYASGKYWAENADGKLEAIPSDLINGEGTARQQAIAFMQSKMQPIIGEIQDKVQQGVGNSTDVTATGFQSLKLPGSGLPEFDRVSGMNPDGTSKTEDQIDREFREVQNQQAELAQGIRFRQ